MRNKVVKKKVVYYYVITEHFKDQIDSKEKYYFI